MYCFYVCASFKDQLDGTETFSYLAIVFFFKKFSTTETSAATTRQRRWMQFCSRVFQKLSPVSLRTNLQTSLSTLLQTADQLCRSQQLLHRNDLHDRQQISGRMFIYNICDVGEATL